MNHRVTFHASGSAQIPGLPEAAFVALVEALTKVGEDPFGHSIAGRRDDPHYREVTFGEYGLAAFYVDRPRRTVAVYDIIWAG
ncbi:hypothetical protein ACWGH8_05350 [Nonomuraea muscovyensis]|uniref:mRNA-degrading endonuclease RelE of RelBE toxin-antitoxin system n=1 Tax=Nonomuraea muscovyensis TaxID=1124761 RepID=A0A7X0C2Z6_9ACTN|nr:hypothetical protein [Nonomuraea muscovyensis]MBB6347544.1 mRNA-degrading endonuclease RelE of RelBE toxin-antitoxin system [Nonomuraea muscovyensis]MDF2706456.1 hypothetical protein [Nonomuraea muscovyensis]